MTLFDLIRRLASKSAIGPVHERKAANLYERLEDRVLFDAVVDGGGDLPEADADPFAPAVESFSDQLFENVAGSATEQSPAQNRNEIVFVDKNVEGFEVLVADLVISNKAEVVFINGATDGLSQIADRLAQRSEIDAIHIISHGDDAQLSLGNSNISADNLASNYSDQLARIGAALTDDGDILIYGCNLTSSAAGESFIQQFSALTGADVAASNDATGSVELGGDWELETSVGEIQTSALASLDWQGLLAAPTMTTPSNPITTVEDAAVTFSGADAISVNDADGGSLTVTLSVADGSLTLFGTTNLTFENGTANGESTIEFTGAIADLNAALDGLQFTPGTDLNGPQSIAIGVTDGSTTTPASIDVAVSAVNDAPVLTVNTIHASGTGTPSETTPHTFSVADFSATDPDNLDVQLTYVIQALPTAGSLRLNGMGVVVGTVFSQADLAAGKLSYVHNGGEVHADSFSISLADGAGGSVATTVVPITITEVNDAMSVKTEVVVYEGGSTDDAQPSAGKPTPGITLTITDAEFDTKTILITSLPAGGELRFDGVAISAGDVAGGFSFAAGDINRLSFVHDGVDDLGTQPSNRSFNIEVTDQGGGTGVPVTVSHTVNINVVSVNDEPILKTLDSTTHTLNFGEYYVLGLADVEVTDPDGDDSQLTYTVEETPSQGSLSINGQFSGAGATFTQADLAAGNVVMSNADGNGPDSLKLTVRDKRINILTDELGTQRVGDYTSAPRVLELNFEMNTSGGPGYSLSLNEGGTETISAAGDGDTIQLNSVPTHGQILINGTPIVVGNLYTLTSTDVVTYAHDATHNDSDVIDWDVNGTAATISVEVLLTNDAPILTIAGPLTGVMEGGSGVITSAMLIAYDEETVLPDEILYTVTSPPASGAIFRDGVALGPFGTFSHQDVIDGLITFTHNGEEDFLDGVKLEISDGSATSSRTLPIQITPVNDQPVVASSSIALLEGGTAVFSSGDLRIADVDGVGDDIGLAEDTPLQIRIDSLPASGTLYYNDPVNGQTAVTPGFVVNQSDIARLSYQHDGSENFSDSFNFTGIDNNTYTNVGFDAPGSVSGVMNVGITPVNDAPVVLQNKGIIDDGVTDNRVYEGGSRTLTSGELFSPDPDSTSTQIQYQLLSKPIYGKLLINGSAAGVGTSFTQQQILDGVVKYVHDGSENFSDVFRFKVDDGSSNVTAQDFVIEVRPVNDAPVITATSATTNVYVSDYAFTGARTISIADKDAGSGDITATITVGDVGGLLRVTTTTGVTVESCV